MVCYLPGTGTFAVIGLAVYIVWHNAITHFLGVVGTATEIPLLFGAEAAVAIALIWTARVIRRRRAQAGACTTCRFRCQEALQGRPNLLVNRVDRRITPPAPIRPVALTSSRPAAAAQAPRPFPPARRTPAPPRSEPFPRANTGPSLPARGTCEPVIRRRNCPLRRLRLLTPDGVDAQPSPAAESRTHDRGGGGGGRGVGRRNPRRVAE